MLVSCGLLYLILYLQFWYLVLCMYVRTTSFLRQMGDKRNPASNFWKDKVVSKGLSPAKLPPLSNHGRSIRRVLLENTVPLQHIPLTNNLTHSGVEPPQHTKDFSSSHPNHFVLMY